MPILTVEMWEGRNIEVKKKLVKDLTDVVSTDLSCPKDAVTVVLKDVPKYNWGIGGELASEKFQ